MSASRLRLNASKTQVLWFVRYQSCRLLHVGVVGSARVLGVVNDSRLMSMADHVASIAQHTITCDRLDPHCSLCHVMLQRYYPNIHLQSPGLLQLSFVQRH